MKKLNIFMLALLIIGQTILGPIGVASASSDLPEQILPSADEENHADTPEVIEPLVIPETPVENVPPTTPQADEDNKQAHPAEEVEPTDDEENSTVSETEEEVVKPNFSSIALNDETEEEEEIRTLADEGEPEISPFNVSYDDMDLDNVTLNTEFKVNGSSVTSPATVKNGDSATFDFTLDDITSLHNYGPGTKLKVTIPSIFNNISGGGPIGDIGSYSVSGNMVTVVFNDEIRSWDQEGNDIGPAPIENVNFYISAEFNHTGNNLNTSVDIPGVNTITLNFTPKDGNTIVKQDGQPKDASESSVSKNAEYIEWTVIVNTDLNKNSTGTFSDTLTGGHKFDTSEAVTITELTLGPNGGPSNYTEGTSSTKMPTYDSDTKMTLSLDSDKAYKITYKTYPEDPGNDTHKFYYNTAEYNDVSSGQKQAEVTYDAPLEKTAGSAQTSDLTTEWTIKVNHNERTLGTGGNNIKVTDSWATSGGSGDGEQELDGTIAVFNKTQNSPATQGTDYQVIMNQDGQGFEVEFLGEFSDAYTITYKTKPTAGTYITDNMTVNNNVTRSDDTDTFKDDASVTYYKTSFMLRKTAEGVNYADKTMTWKIVANQAGYTLPIGTVFEDRFTPDDNQELKSETLTVKDSNGQDVTSTVENPSKAGFDLKLGQEVTGPITIEYKTDYDITDIGTNNRSYQNDVKITEHGIQDMSDPTDSATQTIRGEQGKNGKKDGKYNYATKKFEWEVEVNFNYNSFTNAIFEDEISDDPAQTIENIKIYKGELDNDGDFINPVEVTNVSNTATASNKIKLELGNISTPYKITYDSYVTDKVIPETANKLEVENKATLTEDGDDTPNASWDYKVGVNYTDKLIKKSMDQIGNTAGVKWNFEFNYAQSNLSNIVMTDKVGKDADGNPNQLIKEDSFKVYKVNLSGTSDSKTGGTATKEADEFTNYDLTVDVSNGTFELKINEDGDSAYYIEYETVFLGASGETVENEVEVSYFTHEAMSADDQFDRADFTFGGGGSTTKVPFVIVKTDATTGVLLDGVEFELYRDGIANPILTGTTIDGVLDFKIMLGEGDYTLKEKNYAGYENPGDIPVVLHRDKIAKSGIYKDKQVVEVENFKTGTTACTVFTLTVKGLDNESVKNTDVTLTNKVTGTKYTGKTNADGKVTFPSKVNAGDYIVTTDEGILGDITVNYEAGCADVVKLFPVCPDFRLSVLDRNKNPREENVEIKVKSTNGELVKNSDGTTTHKTETGGTVKLPYIEPGTYTVYEVDDRGYERAINSFIVTEDCFAEVQPRSGGGGGWIPPATCEEFTITVKQNGTKVGADVELTLKSGATEVAKGTTNANGDIVFAKNALPEGTYTAYDKDGKDVGTVTITYEENECQVEIDLKAAPACEAFTITVKESGRVVEAGTSITLKDASGTTVTGTTDANGKISFDKADLPEGSYTVSDKDGEDIGTVTVTYDEGKCQAVIDLVLKACDYYTLTVVDTPNKSVVLKDKEGNTVATGTTDANGKVTFTQPVPEGNYEVHVDGKNVGDLSVTPDSCEGVVTPETDLEEPEEPGKPGEEDPNKPTDPNKPDPNDPNSGEEGDGGGKPGTPGGGVEGEGENKPTTPGSGGQLGDGSTKPGDKLPQTGEESFLLMLSLGVILLAAGGFILFRQRREIRES